MFEYKSELPGDQYIRELKRTIYNCYKYTVFNSGEIICTVLTSPKVTLIYYENRSIRVERKTKLFTKTHYLFYDLLAGEHLGSFKYPDWQSGWKTRCSVELNNGTVFSFVENKAHKSFLKPSTWGRYCFEMSNSKNQIIYTGNRKSGSITFNNAPAILPIALGFFIIDDKFRTDEETSG